MTPPKRHKGTANRLVCALIWWFWESHGSWPHRRVIRVYGFREYFTACGHHLWVEDASIPRTAWRALGMVFPACKGLWDSFELWLWDKPADADIHRYRGM